MLRPRGFTAVASSDLRRARDTATIVAQALRLAVAEPVAALRERDMGEWTGLTRAEIDRRWPGWRDRWRQEELAYLPGGEPRDAFDARVLGALVELGAAHRHGRLLVVAHAGTLRAIDRHVTAVRRRANLDGAWLAVDGSALRPLPAA